MSERSRLLQICIEERAERRRWSSRIRELVSRKQYVGSMFLMPGFHHDRLRDAQRDLARIRQER